MAPLPVNATGRLWVDYNANGRDHAALFRFEAPGIDGFPTEEFLDGVEAVMNAMAPLMPADYTVLGTRISAPGSTISLPGPAIEVGPGGGTANASELPAFMSFPGRTAGGRRTRVSFLGVAASPVQEGGAWVDYRVNASENSTVSAVIGLLNSAPIVGIDNLEPTWYTYANAGYNAYWQRKARG